MAFLRGKIYENKTKRVALSTSSKKGANMEYLKNVRLHGEITDIGIDQGKIVSIGKTSEGGYECKGLKIYPGLIDIHSHGCIGFDTMDEEDHLKEMSEYQLSCGTTTWYPTTMTMSREDIIRATSRDISFTEGATIAGFHMEGPFINPKYKGAMNENFIFRPDMTLFKECSNIKMVTLAPELPGSKKFIEECPAIISIGHTDADYDTAMGAFRTGAKCLTHAFNAMPGVHHRAPGPLMAAMDSENAYVQLIADGKHIHPSVIRMYVRAVGEDRVILISDCMCATGLSDGEYVFGGQKIIVKDATALTETGHLAGSTVTLFECVKTAISMGISEESAVKMATENPAKLMGLNKGKIEVGYDADFILVDDDFNLKKVIKQGVL